MRDALPKRSSNPILDFDNKLMKGTKKFCKFLEDISKGVRFYKAAALQPVYIYQKEHSSEENFHGYAKILIRDILCRRTTPETYLETYIYDGAFLRKKAAIFS